MNQSSTQEHRFYPPGFLMHGAGVRYNPVDIPLSWTQTIVMFLQYGVWKRTYQGFSQPIYPGEPGYADAIYESTMIYDPEEMKRLTNPHPMS